MKILILHPGKIPKTPEQISCFSEVWSYYLINELRHHVMLDTTAIPNLEENDLIEWFDTVEVSGYDAVIALGLRYFSTVPREIGEDLKRRVFPGFLCQLHDGSRLSNDPVDITFTLKNENDKYPFGSEANRFVRHHATNVYVGWASDPEINYPQQDPDILGILVDHTNYGKNEKDNTQDVLKQIESFILSGVWRSRYRGVRIRRFDSGCIVDVDFSQIHNIERYNRKAIPFTDVCREHGAAHIFCVTHPESVGLVVLETAMAGALTITPQDFIPRDRLDTVRAIEYQDEIPWSQVLDEIDPQASRQKALANSWTAVCKRIRDNLRIRQEIRGRP